MGALSSSRNRTVEAVTARYVALDDGRTRQTAYLVYYKNSRRLEIQFMLVALAFEFDGVCWLLVTSTKTGISSATTSRWPTVGGGIINEGQKNCSIQ